MKFIITIFFFFLTSILFAGKVEVTSTSMKADNIKKEVVFVGNVKITQEKDWLHANKITVTFNDNNKTKKYEAMGSVKFQFKNDKSFYKGHANKVMYYPLKSLYVLSGKALVEDKINKRTVKGETIMLNMLTGFASVKGTRKKPVKFIFDMGKK